MSTTCLSGVCHVVLNCVDLAHDVLCSQMFRVYAAQICIRHTVLVVKVACMHKCHLCAVHYLQLTA